MNVTVERVENEATLKITAPAAEVNAGYKKAVQKIADQANIPGFRKGKAPRAIIEMHYGKEAVKQEAFDGTLRYAGRSYPAEDSGCFSGADSAGVR